MTLTVEGERELLFHQFKWECVKSDWYLPAVIYIALIALRLSSRPVPGLYQADGYLLTPPFFHQPWRSRLA